MATVHDVLSSMQGLISAQLVGVTSPVTGTLNVQVGTEWPPMKVLQQSVKGGTVLVSVFDRRRGLDSTRWVPAIVYETTALPQLMSSITSQTLPLSLYLGGAVQAGDAVSLVATLPPGSMLGGQIVRSAAVVANVVAGDTLDTISARLAAAIAADPLMSQVCTATAVSSGVGSTMNLIELGVPMGGYAAITNLPLSASSVAYNSSGALPTMNLIELGVLYGVYETIPGQQLAPPATFYTNVGGTGQQLAPPATFYTNVGGTGQRVVEVGRRNRELQVTVWASYEEDRMAVGDQIEALLSAIEVHRTPYESGIPLPNNTSGRLLMSSDYYLDDAVLTGVLRRDFLVRVDHPVTNVDVLYSVLAPVMQYSV